jgi:hypothetical protein
MVTTLTLKSSRRSWMSVAVAPGLGHECEPAFEQRRSRLTALRRPPKLRLGRWESWVSRMASIKEPGSPRQPDSVLMIASGGTSNVGRAQSTQPGNAQNRVRSFPRASAYRQQSRRVRFGRAGAAAERLARLASSARMGRMCSAPLHRARVVASSTSR